MSQVKDVSPFPYPYSLTHVTKLILILFICFSNARAIELKSRFRHFTSLDGQGEERIAKLFDSPSMPEAECSFKITSGGIADTD